MNQLTPPASAYPLAAFACVPEQTRGRLHKRPEDHSRSAFQRDRDRIIHSVAFRRLRNKTQVFIESEGDYYRTRLTHSLEVAQIARSLARALQVNEDLTEAVALAHDLGHTCFGHAGEDALAACMLPYGGFSHNDQTFRILTQLESRYIRFDGLNLTWETLEGVAKHNGPLLPAPPGHPVPPTIAAFSQNWDLELASHAGLEAQLAAIADDIAYNTHDIDDGYRCGFLTLEDIRALPLFGPELAALEREYPGADADRIMHEVVRRVVHHLVTDLLENTQANLAAVRPQSAQDIRNAGRPLAAFSGSMRAQEQALRAFLMEKLYRATRINRMTSKARRVVRELFAFFMAEPSTLPAPWYAQVQGQDDTAKARRISDYIAGMTDRFALLEYRRLFSVEVVI